MAAASPPCLLVTVGSVGDMHPFLGLGRALQARGHRVTLVGTGYHAALVRRAGLPFVGIGSREDYLRILGNPDIWHPFKGVAALFSGVRGPLADMAQALVRLAAGAPAVVISHPFGLPAAAIARETGAALQVVGAFLAPSNLPTVHDPMIVGPLRVPRWVPAAARRALWRLGERTLVDPVATAEVNAARAAAGLAPVPGFLPHLLQVPDLALALFPPWFAAPQPDWPQPLLMGEFPLFDPAADDPLPAPLRAFLDAGEAPVVFTPGTAQRHAEAYFRHAAAAVARLRRRAVFLTPHRAQVPATLPQAIHWQPYVALRTLLPRAAALVHHGGIGTTAEALRVGVPQLVAPFAWDQFDNAFRVRALGVGDSLPASRFRAPALARRLGLLLASATVPPRCAEVAARFAPGAAGRLCRALEARLGLAP